ncbi:uncharacterized protein LOC110456914 isoform X2 [Mizuhopecten yessoensis]|uniref:uncharacterized protein LOC110456914 isoform X2 n=1 Tax=Mizuhopecten yessoensis TaxID=6573 RepID=UPI000B457F54|nr:uncharacterized protein LOC110456914 isoform X2 [Mizuhopecten yessoensis]
MRFLDGYVPLVFILHLGCVLSQNGVAVPLCEDLADISCVILLKIVPDMCSRECYVSICRRTCGRCPLRCFHCNNVSSLAMCRTTQECAADELCLETQRLDDSLQIYYTATCAERKLCETLYGYPAPQGPVIGRKRAYGLHGKCCDSDYCNSDDTESSTVVPHLTHPPGQISTVTSVIDNTLNGLNGTCSPLNVDNGACVLLELSDPLLCQRRCVADTICPETCGTCLTCYDCNAVSSPDACPTIKTCKAHEKCITVESLDNNFNIIYKLGCVTEQVCDTFFGWASNTYVDTRQVGTNRKGQCCRTKLCNKHGIQGSTATQPSPIGK